MSNTDDMRTPPSSTKNHETVTLQVQIPADVQVGSTINVMYDDNYYQIVVPENGPGNSIQVILPNIPLPMVSAYSPDEHVTSDVNDVSEEKDSTKISRTAAVAVAGAAVVGVLVIGPIITGAAVLGGAAVYVLSKQKHDDNEAQYDPNSYMGKAAHITSKAAESAGVIVSAGVNKAKEIDERAKISETLGHVSSTVVQKVRATDEKYKITEKTSVAVTDTVEAVKRFDERHKISATASETASKAATKAKEIDDQYEISANISRAISHGAAALGKFVSTAGSQASQSTTAAAAAEPVTEDVK